MVDYRRLIYRTFDAVDFESRRAIAKDFFQTCQLQSYVELETQNMIVELRKRVYAEEIQNETVTLTASLKVPGTWWDHFKLNHFPKWLEKRFPVKYRVETTTQKHTFKVKDCYPEFPTQSELGPRITKVFVESGSKEIFNVQVFSCGGDFQ